MRLRQQEVVFSREEPASAQRRKQINRQRLREFLRAVPRTEPESGLELLGRERGMPPEFLSRQALTEAIEQLPPRMRQIIRLCLEERNTRRQVQAYLHGISLRTLERDQARGLDFLLAQAKVLEK